jgi:uncharacterized membrane protein
MNALSKNKIGLSIILMALICFISLPSLTLSASAQPATSQTTQTPFNSIVNNADFSIYASPSYLSIAAGGSVNATIMVMSRYNFNGTISLSASAPVGWTASLNPSSLSLANGYYGYPYYSYYYYGTYNWSTLSIAVPSDAAAGKYTVIVSGTNGSLTHTANVTVNVVAPDFLMNAYPSSLSVSAGSTGNSTILISSLYGFSGTVSLSASVPAGWSALFVPSSLSMTAGSYNWSMLSIAVPPGTVAGKYTVTVTGTSGALAHSANVTVNVVAPDFWINAYPSYLWVTAGSSVNSTIMLMSRYGFNGTVSLAASVPSGWSASFVPSSVSLANGYAGYYYYGSYNWSTLSIAVPSGAATGKYTIVVTGSSGSLSRSVNVTVNVVAPDFWISAYPSYLSVSAGSTANSTIVLASLYGFTGPVSLAASVPSGWSAAFVSSSLSVTAGYFNCSALSVAVPSGTAAGKYTVVVTCSSGALTHSANVTVNVGGSNFWRLP